MFIFNSLIILIILNLLMYTCKYDIIFIIIFNIFKSILVLIYFSLVIILIIIFFFFKILKNIYSKDPIAIEL